MTGNRTAATLILLLTAAAPAVARAATHSAPLTSRAPSWLASPAPVHAPGSSGRQKIGAPSARGTAPAAARAGLPTTGADLITEAVSALGLLGTGVALRTGLHGRRT